MNKIEETQREAVMAAVAEALGDAYLCGRVWSAWRAGTMSEDDFSPASEDSDFVAEIADAAIAVLHKEPRGTEAQILKERELTASAAVGAMAYGYQGGERPPDSSAWLAPFYEVGQRDAESQAVIAKLSSVLAEASIALKVKNYPQMECADYKEIGKKVLAKVLECELRTYANDVMKAGLIEVEALISGSQGVSGLHLNSNLAEWESIRTGGEYESWLLEFDKALEMAKVLV